MKLSPMVDLRHVRIGFLHRRILPLLSLLTRRGRYRLYCRIDAYCAAHPKRTWMPAAVAVVIWVALWSRK
jgi:hypothetical protein